MYAEVSTDSLTEGLGPLLAVAGNAGALPLLSCLLLEAEPRRGLTLSCTDLDVTLQVTIPGAVVARGGAALLPAKVFCDAVRALDSDPRCSLRAEQQAERTRLVIKSGGSLFRLAGIDPESFPARPRPASAGGVAVPASRLAQAMERVLPVASYGGGMTLKCAQIRVATDGLMAIATDGHRIALAEEHLAKNGDLAAVRYPLILASRAGILLAQIARANGDATIEIGESADGQHLALLVGSTRIYLRKVAVEYPDCLSALPAKRPSVVAIRTQRAAMVAAMRRCSVLAKERFTSVELEWFASTKTLTMALANSDLGASAETIKCEPDGGDGTLPVRVNVRYLLESFEAFTDFDEMELAWDEKLVCVRPVNGGNALTGGLIIAAAIHRQAAEPAAADAVAETAAAQ